MQTSPRPVKWDSQNRTPNEFHVRAIGPRVNDTESLNSTVNRYLSVLFIFATLLVLVCSGIALAAERPAEPSSSIQPIIKWAPLSPEIGEVVLFSIVNDDGSPLDVKSASWDLGGGGCDGADSTPDCVSSIWIDCDSQSFKYNSSGLKTVSVSAEIGDDTIHPVDVT